MIMSKCKNCDCGPSSEKIDYYKIDSNVRSPEFSTQGSACFDLYSYLPEGMSVKIYDYWNESRYYIVGEDKQVTLGENDTALIPTGIIFDIPKKWSIRLHARSGLSLKRGLVLQNSEGIIDSDYIDPVYVMVRNSRGAPLMIGSNMKLCQAEAVKNASYILTSTNKSPGQKTDRVGGFGSTGY